MLAVHGYYDGKVIKLLEKIEAKPNQRVIVTIIDDSFIENNTNSTEKSKKKQDDTKNETYNREQEIEDMMGILAKYANDNLKKKEKEAWGEAVEEKYGSNV